MSNEENEIKQTIRDMAKLSVLSGKISESQEKNLKMFPLIMFNGVKSAIIDYDLANRLDRMVQKEDEKDKEKAVYTVSYKLSIDDNADNSPLDRRFLALESSVRSIFWKDIVVKVYFNDRKVYESKSDVK